LCAGTTRQGASRPARHIGARRYVGGSRPVPDRRSISTQAALQGIKGPEARDRFRPYCSSGRPHALAATGARGYSGLHEAAGSDPLRAPLSPSAHPVPDEPTPIDVQSRSALLEEVRRSRQTGCGPSPHTQVPGGGVLLADRVGYRPWQDRRWRPTARALKTRSAAPGGERSRGTPGSALVLYSRGAGPLRPDGRPPRWAACVPYRAREPLADC